MLRPQLSALLLGWVVLSSPGLAQTAPDKVRQLFQDRKYDEALPAIAEATKDDKADQAYLQYLTGRAWHLAGKYDEAIAAFDKLNQRDPKSDWARRARFSKALSLVKKGDFRAAETIYKQESEFLLSTTRKQDIAGIYLEFADAYFKPPKDEQQPDFNKALQFYQQALDVGPAPDKKIAIELRVAECLQKLNNLPEAAKRYAQFSKDHADSRLDVEARYRLGECQLAQGQNVEARRTWEDLLALRADQKSERLAEALFHLAETYGVPTPGNDRDLSLGVAALAKFIEKHPDHKLASLAHLRVAQSYLHLARHADAAKAIDQLLRDPRYANREEIPEARNLLGQSLLLQKKFVAAIAAWKDYLTKHPAHRAWSEVQQQIVRAEFLIAAEHRQEKRYDKAREAWTAFLEKYPLDERAANIMVQFGQMNFDQKKWEEAIADWRRVVSKYPDSGEAGVAQLLIGITLEEKLGKLEEAIEAYKKVDGSPEAQNRAVRRIAQLTEKSLNVATERVFRSGETPRLKVRTRNIEKLTVRAFTVDLETYFRKMHLARGVEGLDIALIDPDKQFEFPVPKYAKHQSLESEIEIPLPAIGKVSGTLPKVPDTLDGASSTKAGVLAVTVSSETLEATTLVLQSDLDVIVKSSRDEVFVFAENMKTGAAWGNVKLLISNGQKVFAEGATGQDGVFQKTYEELKGAGDVRVFAIVDGHVASNIVDLSGLNAAQGLADKGYIYTERPVYRAGQLVHVRGVIRKVTGDTYTIEKGKKFTLQVLDPRGRQLRQDQVALNDFGSFHTNFILPEGAASGDYRLVVTDSDKQNYAGAFRVQEYQLEPVRLTVESARRVFYRGEEIEGTIKANFYYGAPLVDKEIRYQLANDRLFTAKTNAQGEVKFKLPTRDFAEGQTLPLVVTLPERNLTTTQPYFLAAQGFSLSLSTVRPVYLAGESFELSIKAADAEGKPVAEKLTVRVLEQTNVGGKLGEREVAQHEITTAKETGAAKQVLKVAGGGYHILRVEGTDRFKNPVTAQHIVQISDDKDETRLRILADKHTFKVGDQGSVTLHWREQPALALVTYHGAKVLGYKVLKLQTGENKLDLPITATLAPNFELNVAVMLDVRPARKADVKDGETAKPLARFHEANSPFVVERDLKVKFETRRKNNATGPVLPGEEMDVVITTTDPAGKPLAAEVSLAMVEQALLDRYSFATGPIGEFFGGGLRAPAVRTAASITFVYNPSTQKINPRLLAEKDRLEIAKEEGERIAILLPLRKQMQLQQMEKVQEAQKALGDVLSERRMRHLEEAKQMLGGRREQAQQMAQAAKEVEAVDRQQEAIDELEMQVVQSVAGITWYGEADLDISATDADYALSDSPEKLEKFAVGRSGDGPASGRFAVEYVEPLGVVIVRGRPSDADKISKMIRKDSRVFTDKITASPNLHWGELTGRRSKFGLYSEVVEVTGMAGQNGSAAEMAYETRDLTIMNRDGSLYFDRFDKDEKSADELVTKLRREGAVLLPPGMSHETAYWNPAIATDASGQAKLVVPVPERATAWRLLAKGVTAQTLAGEATHDVTVRKELFGEIKLPLAFTAGDEATIPVTVHNYKLESGKIEVTLKTTIGDKSTTETKTIDVKATGLHDVAFKLSLPKPEKDDKQPGVTRHVAFELAVSADKLRDTVRRTLPLLPLGMPVYAVASGAADADTAAWVEPPKGLALAGQNLQVVIGPTVERSLLDVLLAPAHPCQHELLALASSGESATSDLLAAVALLELFPGTRQAGTPQAQAIDGRIRAALSLLVSGQNDDGGWSWTGRAAKSDRYSSARVIWALALAKAAGYPVPDENFHKGTTYLNSQIAQTRNNDYESKAILLQALTVAGKGDFALANRLYRDRASLSNAGLAYLALAFAEMDRGPTAEELLTALTARNLDDVALKRSAANGVLPWSGTSVETRALAALAWQKVKPTAPAVKELADWLLAHRTGHRWSPDKATGPAALALGRYFGKSRYEAQKYELTITVNGNEVKKMALAADALTQTVEIPARLLKDGKQQINFQLTGRGRYSYQCVLGGFVAADKLVSTTKNWKVERDYEPAPLEFDGKVVPRGFSALTGSYTAFKNPLTQLPIGRRGVVELRLTRAQMPSETPDEDLEYLVIMEPLPSGATVVENSVQGGFERYELSPGAITFYVGSRKFVNHIRYEVHGYVAGQYQAAPTVVRDAYRPDQLAVATTKSLAILPADAKSVDAYRLTPDELLALGKLRFAKKEYAESIKLLAELIGKWNLQPQAYKDSVQLLLDSHLAIGPAAEVVRYFEIVKEKWPELEIPFDKILKVGQAYHDIGEYERSYLVFRATVESSFLRESVVAGFLESQGEFERSVDVLGRLLREYPPEQYVATATYSLAQRVYAKAPQAANDPKLREKKIHRVDLIHRAYTMLENFLTVYPDDPAADQAAFSAAGALLELKKYREAIAACNRYAARYPKSDFVDSYWYVIGYGHFALGEHQQALEMCRKVAETKRTDPQTGREVESPNKWQAIYILGQVYHSLGQAAQAIVEYTQVKDRFSDAAQAIEYFAHKAIALPEVTTKKPGEAVELALKYRNVPACDVKVYRIDLMKFSLLRRDLAGITQINLSGIRPYHETTVQLGDGKDYQDKEKKIALPLKDEGAYLVVGRGDDLHTSGLVLVTPLAIEVQEENAAGRVRATVKDTLKDKYVADTHVKVIGSHNDDFVSGQTDLRGVFVADSIRGKSTVIAQADGGRYAFFRGQAELGPPPTPATKAPEESTPAKPQAATGKEAADGELLKGLLERNQSLQRQQSDQLQQLYDNKEKGVKVEQLKK